MGYRGGKNGWKSGGGNKGGGLGTGKSVKRCGGNNGGGNYYVYTLNLKGGKKYVGYTGNPKARMKQHFGGYGSAVTKSCPPVSVHSMKKCSSQKAAKNAERIVYENMKAYHGSDKVRGAGNTRRF